MNTESNPSFTSEPNASLQTGVDHWSALLQNSESELAKAQAEIDAIAYDLYGIEGDDRAAIEAMMQSADAEADDADADGQDENLTSADPAKLTSELLDYCVGVAFGRWDICYATGEKAAPPEPDPFEALPLCAPGMLQNAEGLPAKANEVDAGYPIRISWEGILVDDSTHEEDLYKRVLEALTLMWGEQVGSIEQEACDFLGVRSLRDYFAEKKVGGRYFKEHLSRFSKSRRKAPLYWPISTESGTYTLWLYYPRLSTNTLYSAVTQFIEPKQTEVQETFAKLNAKQTRTKSEDKELEHAHLLVAELATLRESLLEIAQFWKPDLNDGVQITAAPLWKHFRLKPWQKTLKDTWGKLDNGDFDWAHLAHSIWPKRVIQKCIDDRSLAIAHGHDEALWAKTTDAKGKSKWQTRQNAEAIAEELISQQTV